jgi:hypothetical protein
MANDRVGQTGAQVRGAIQQGITGDIRPGFDPAAAPYETDAEAGGMPTAAAAETFMPIGKSEAAQGNYDVAMREPGTGKTTSQTGKVAPYAMIVVALIALLLVLAVLSWVFEF